MKPHLMSMDTKPSLHHVQTPPPHLGVDGELDLVSLTQGVGDVDLQRGVRLQIHVHCPRLQENKDHMSHNAPHPLISRRSGEGQSADTNYLITGHMINIMRTTSMSWTPVFSDRKSNGGETRGGSHVFVFYSFFVFFHIQSNFQTSLIFLTHTHTVCVVNNQSIYLLFTDLWGGVDRRPLRAHYLKERERERERERARERETERERDTERQRERERERETQTDRQTERECHVTLWGFD